MMPGMRWAVHAATALWRRVRPVAARCRPDRNRRQARLGCEGLEHRESLSAGGLVPFTSIPGEFGGPARISYVVLRLAPGQFVSDRSMPMLLGFEARPAAGSATAPRVARVIPLSAPRPHQVRTRFGPLLTQVSVPLSQPDAYAIEVVNRDRTPGGFVLDAYLPGDVNHSGTVSRVDIAAIRASYGSRFPGPRYNPAADFNQDGRVGLTDLGLARRNLGATTSVLSFAAINRPFVFPSRA